MGSAFAETDDVTGESDVCLTSREVVRGSKLRNEVGSTTLNEQEASVVVRCEDSSSTSCGVAGVDGINTSREVVSENPLKTM